jgi:hypothetical protein
VNNSEISAEGRGWIARCTKRMQEVNRQIDPTEAEQLARAGWKIARLRALAPDEAARHILKNPIVRPTPPEP